MASELSMNGRKKIETIQKEFTQKFPFLTLVFLDQQRRAIDISKSLSEVRQAKGADISIIASLKVNTLEKRFNESFGLIVEVAYQKEGKVIYTKDNVDKTLNELNKWCETHECEPFEFKKSFTGNTISSVQEQLFEAIKSSFKDAEAKKINKDNFLDIYIPSVSPARGTHLFFNTSKNDIKVGYYTRDENFINNVTNGAPKEIEAASNGLRITGNPKFENVNDAISAALNFLGGILNDKSFIDNKIGAKTIDIKSDKDDNIIVNFVENFGNDDLSGFLENYLESDKIVVLSISKSDLEAATNENIDYSENVEILGRVEMNDWKGLSKLIGKKEADWANEELRQENASAIVLLYSEGKYVYAFSNPSEQEEDSEPIFDMNLDEMIKNLGFDDEEHTGSNQVVDSEDDSKETNSTSESDILMLIDELSKYEEDEKVEIKFYTDSHSEMTFWLKFELNDSIIEVTRINWSEDSYWVGLTEIKNLKEGLINFSKNNDKEELINDYLSTDWVDYSFDGCGNEDNGLNYEITDISPELETIPDEFQDYSGDLDMVELTNNLSPISEELSEQSIGDPVFYEVSLNGKTYKINLDQNTFDGDFQNNIENHEDGDKMPAKKAVPNILPKNAVELVKCVSILSFYYLSLNNNKEIYDKFQTGLKNLFSKKNFGDSESDIVQEIKAHFANNTIDELIEEGERLANEAYDKKYETHIDFLSDISRYIKHLDDVDDAKFQLAYIKTFIELGNSLSNSTDNGNEIKIQDRYLIVQIALSKWYNISDIESQVDEFLKSIKYNFSYGDLYKYSMLSNSLSLIEKAALFTYNLILLDEDGLEIKNGDIIRAKQLIAEVFGFEIKFEGGVLKGSYNNSGSDDLSQLIGGFDENFCFNVMHFYNCHFSIDDFRYRCKELFVESYQEINDLWGGYIEDRIEEIEFDAEDEREEKILDQYNEARHEAEDEE